VVFTDYFDYLYTLYTLHSVQRVMLRRKVIMKHEYDGICKGAVLTYWKVIFQIKA